MGVDLGAAEARVTEHLLHHPEVGAAVEQVRGGAVAQRMGPARPSAGLLLQLSRDQPVDGAGRAPAPLAAEEEDPRVLALPTREQPGPDVYKRQPSPRSRRWASPPWPRSV